MDKKNVILKRDGVEVTRGSWVHLVDNVPEVRNEAVSQM